MTDHLDDDSRLVSAKEYAERQNDTEEHIVQMIRDGRLAGRIQNNIWYVDVALSGEMSSQFDERVARTESVSEEIDPKLTGIGGWLILPAIGFVLGPVIGIIGLGVAVSMFPDVSRAGYGGLFGIELLVSLGLLVFLFYTATLFFSKKSNAPSTIIKYLVVSIIASVVLLAMEVGSGVEVFAVQTVKQLVRELISAAIWVPYFRRSKRVWATFVN